MEIDLSASPNLSRMFGDGAASADRKTIILDVVERTAARRGWQRGAEIVEKLRRCTEAEVETLLREVITDAPNRPEVVETWCARHLDPSAGSAAVLQPAVVEGTAQH
jgi:hypothetical protein